MEPAPKAISTMLATMPPYWKSLLMLPAFLRLVKTQRVSRRAGAAPSAQRTGSYP
jgi:hypothetical protein